MEHKDRSELVGPNGRRSALLIHNIQEDYFKGGAFPVDNNNNSSDNLIQQINKLKSQVPFNLIVIITQNHPTDHITFLDTHLHTADYKLFQTIHLNGNNYILTPKHNITQGDNNTIQTLHKQYAKEGNEIIVGTGTNRVYSSFSGFNDEHGHNPTGLYQILKKNNILDCYIAGIGIQTVNTAQQAQNLGFSSYFLSDLCLFHSELYDKSQLYLELEAHKVKLMNSLVLFNIKQQDKRVEASQYLTENNINNLFDYLLTQTLISRPDNPKQYLISQLEAIQNNKIELKQLNSATIYTDQEFEIMFQMVDAVKQGSLTKNQVNKALINIGITEKRIESLKIGEKTNLTEFKQLCAKAIKP